VETHLAGDGGVPCIPGYRVWQLCRSGALRPSGGIAVLVHERFGAAVSLWQADGQHTPSPYHLWLRFDGAHCLQRPLFLAAVYLPPYRSKYGLKSSTELEEYFTVVGDEVAAVAATPGGADVLLGGDFNSHTGSLPDWDDHSVVLQNALEEAAEEVLLPCAVQGAACAPEPRASSCTAAVCEQGRALLQLCCCTGMLIANGRVQGDLAGSPTCYTSHSSSVVDYFVASPSFVSQAAEMQVLPEVPEYRGHRPLTLQLAPPPPSALQRSPAQCAAPESDSYGPPPSFAAPLRIIPDSLSSFASELEQPATMAQLLYLAATASSDPLQAATQLHAVLYSAAAAVFPPASSGPQQRTGSTSRQLRKRHQPWFDAECAAARQQVRQQLLANLTSGQPSHLAKAALHAISSRFTWLRQRKAAAWQRQQGSALLQLQRRDSRKFYKLWKRQHPKSPIDAASWQRHFVNLQLKRKFQPSRGRTLARTRSRSPSHAAPLAAEDSGRPPPPPLPDAELDRDITTADITAALRKLSPSSASLGPLKAVLIKAGGDALTPVLASLFTAVLRSGCFPPEWALGAITPIHKKGDTADPNNYRGITVGHVLGKLYALVINARLTTWLEARGLRAKGQAGFRQGYRTVENCFILRALAERARARGDKLYICAVDFEKAFDSVDRPLLWAALQRAGIGGNMLQAITAMYADVPVCVKSAEGLSGCFQSMLGVKQGCPLSPLLFGIFLDDWETHLQSVVGATADQPCLAGRKVPPLLFADDMFLIALSPAGLQAQLDCLQDYCDAKKITVNAAKTQVMIMRPGGGNGKLAAGESFSYAGRPLEVVGSVKYLGLTFSQLSKQRGFASCADVLAKAGRQAMFAMRRRARELGACTVEQQCMLFDVFVKPVLSYGCEVWGVDLLLRTDCSSVERVHRWFCRRLQGLPKQVTSAVSLAELGRQPLHLFWVQQLVRFWNHLQASMSEPDRPLGWALEDNLALMREGADLAAGSACWCRRWQQFLQSAPTDSGTLVWLTKLDEGAIVERASAAYIRQSTQPATPSTQQQQHDTAPTPAALPEGSSTVVAPLVPAGAGRPAVDWQQDYAAGHDVALPTADSPPTAAGSTSRTNKFAYYLHCIRGDVPFSQPAPHLLQVTNIKHRISLSRFRTSCHDLRIERERYLPEPIRAPCHMRTCLQCASPAVEDETHMVFHCPIYDCLRFEYADLFPPHLPEYIPCFLSQDQKRVASFIHDCSVLRRRNACMSLAGSESAL
jgi:hypothetical protein